MQPRGGRQGGTAGHRCCCQGNCRHQGAPGLLPRLPFLGLSHWGRVGAPCGEPAIMRAPRNHRDSRRGAKPTTALQSQSCGKQGRGPCGLLIAAHPAGEGRTEKSEAVASRRAEQGPGGERKNPAEEGRASPRGRASGSPTPGTQHLPAAGAGTPAVLSNAGSRSAAGAGRRAVAWGSLPEQQPSLSLSPARAGHTGSCPHFPGEAGQKALGLYGKLLCLCPGRP